MGWLLEGKENCLFLKNEEITRVYVDERDLLDREDGDTRERVGVALGKRRRVVIYNRRVSLLQKHFHSNDGWSERVPLLCRCDGGTLCKFSSSVFLSEIGTRTSHEVRGKGAVVEDFI